MLLSTYYVSVESNASFYVYCSEPDCGMASWEAQKYFKQLISGVVSEFLVSLLSFLLEVVICLPIVIITKYNLLLALEVLAGRIL